MQGTRYRFSTGDLRDGGRRPAKRWARRWRTGLLSGGLLWTILLPIGSYGQLVINELMYHPYEPFGVTNETEYVELYNAGTSPIDLSVYRFDNGVSFTFPQGATLPTGAYAVVCQNVAAFQEDYPGVTANVYGDFAGSLRNSGERVTLSTRDSSNNWVTADTIDYIELGASDGDGPSLELVNPGFARLRDYAHGSWAVSTAANGTPGEQNSVYDSSPPPVVANTTHTPPLPPAGGSIRIECRAVAYDSDALSQVQVLYRVTQTPAADWQSAPMEDQGLNGDLVAGDGVYAVRLPPYGKPTFAAGAVLEFRIEVTDGWAQTTTAPLANTTSNELGSPPGPFSYLVKFGEDTSYTGEYDAYHILMTDANRNTLETRDVQDDHLLDATLITGDGEVFYNCGVRFRGGSSRGDKLGYRIELPASRRYESYSELNLNHYKALNQYMGHELANRMGFGVKGQEVEMCHVWLNGVDKSALTTQKIHCRIEGFDGHIISRYFGDEDWGNLYKSDGDGYDGDLSYSANLNDYVTGSSGIYRYISSLNNPPEAWSDIQDLCRTVNLPTNELIEAMPQRVNVRAWARLYALQVCMANNESGWFDPYSTRGDELRLYSHPITGVFDLFPWDMDAMLERSDSSVWLWNHGPTRNLLFHPPMSSYYIGDVLDLLNTTIGNTAMNAFWDDMGSALAAQSNVRTSWQNNLNSLRSNLKAVISTNLTVSVSSTVSSGTIATIVNASPVTFSGSFPQNYTAAVRVNGVDAGWQAWNVASMQTQYGKWSTAVNSTDLALPANSATPVLVEAVDSDGNTLKSQSFTLVRQTTTTSKSAPITSSETWASGVNGVIQVTGALQISAGATVTVAEGTVVLIAPGGSITVLDGTLAFEGTPDAPTWVLPSNGSSAWSITGGGAAASITASNTVFAGGTLSVTAGADIELTDCTVRDSSNALGMLQSSTGCDATLVRCIVSGYAKTAFSGTTLIRDCLFRNMSTTGIELGGGNATVEKTTVHSAASLSPSSGIRLTGGVDATVTNVLVHTIAGIGIYASGSGTAALVANGLVHASGTGLRRDSPATTSGSNVTIARCSTGLNGSMTLSDLIVWGNTNGVVSGPASLNYSDIQQTTTNSYAGTGNLNRNPWFRDPDALDFRLQPISPGIGSGSTGQDMGCLFPAGANPAAPSALALASSVIGTTNRVTVTWTDNSEAENAFEVERRVDGGMWTQIGTVEADVTVYRDDTVLGNVPYSYRVRAVHARGESLYSETDTIVTSPEAYTQKLIDNLRITEVMYNPTNNPPEVSDLEEFIELKNISTTETLDLSGLYTDNDRYRFATNPAVLLGPQAFFVLARNTNSFLSRYGVAADAGYIVDDKLSNSGEALWIRDALNNKVIEVEYDSDWYVTTDDQGYSLVTVDQNPVNPSNTTTESYWRASTNPGGSPGTDDPDPGYGNIVINELLTHTDYPLEDAVELYNAGTSAVDIAGWFLSDSQSDLTKYQIPAPSLVIPAGGYHVFYEGNSFNASPGATDQFELSSLGDSLYLSSSDGTNLTGFRASVSVGAADNGVSFGRYTRSDGVVDFVSMSEHTFGVGNPTSVSQFRTGTGMTNAAALIGPVVINEIMYNPTAGGKEFVELLNRTGAPVALFDPANPTNTWLFNGAMEYSFPTGITLSAGEIVLLTGTEPALFREVTGLTNASLRIFGPYNGDLNNAGESVKLYYPDQPETNGFVPYILSDRVKYGDSAPWPVLADNGGPSLERIDPDAYGNDPTNWVASTLGGTPLGANNTTAVPSASFVATTSTALESDGIAALAVRVFPTPTEAQGPVTVHYAVTGGTAGESDYTLGAGSLLFWPNDGEKTIQVAITADGIALEPDETVEVSLTSVSGPAILGGNRIHTLTIRDTDIGTVAPPQILPVSGDFYKSINVTVTTTNENATIYYTLDGTDPRRDTQLVAGGYRPSATAILYTGPFTNTASARVKACAFVGRYNASAPTSALFVEKTPMQEYPPGTITVQIHQGSDDAEESNGLTVRTGDAQLLIGRSASYVMEYGGLRFTDIGIPQGADVTNAYVQFTSAGAGGQTITVSIYAQSADNAPTFNSGNIGDIRPPTDFGGGYIIGWRGRTINAATWQPAAWSGADMAGIAQRTPNICDVIQEVVDRPGWSEGNAIVLLLTYSYNKFPTAPPYATRPAKTYENSPEKSAVLFVQYDVDSVSPNPDADDDGMPDEWETTHFGSADAVNGGPTDDWDHDGADNLSEYIADTIPTNNESLFVAVEVSSDGSGNTIRWPSVTTRLYSVWRVADLINQSMDPLQSNIAGHISGTNTYTDVSNTNSNVFYRLKVAVPE